MFPRLNFVVRPALALTIASAALGQSPGPPEAKIIVSSAGFQSHGAIPDQFTCKGANVNPGLQFRGAPAQAKSFAIIVEDPDAPSGLFTHWMVWNVAPEMKQVGERSVPTGAVQGTNDFGNVGYGGPCPPSGTHRYLFHVLALDTLLDLKPGARRPELNQAIAGHVLGRGELMARASAR